MTPAASPTDSHPGGPYPFGAAAGAAPRGVLAIVGAGLLVGISGVILVGVGLGLVGWYRPVVALGAGIVAAMVAVWCMVRSGAGWEMPPPDIAVVVLIGAWAVWGAGNASQQVFPTTDPGVYLTTAWYLADGEGPALEVAPGLLDQTDGTFGLSGYQDDRGDGSLSPQFPRGLPVVLSVARWAGGTGALFLAPVAIAKGGLLLFYLLARLLVPGWWAVLATAALGVSLPFVHFGRGAYSEPLMLLLVVGACWMLVPALQRPGWGWGAGLGLGAALCVRIDALVVVTVVPVLAAYVVGARRPVLPWMRRLVPALALGAAVAVADLVILSPSYWRAQDRRLTMVALLVGASTLVAAFAPRLVRIASSVLAPHRRRIAATVTVVLFVAAGFVFLIRPFGPTAHTTTGRNDYLAILLAREGHLPDPTRTMAESTGLWLWWYLGPLLVAGVVGFVMLTRRALLRYRPESVLLLTMTGVTGAIYLWRPSINPLHIWAMRRFLPVVIPGLTLLGVVALAALAGRFRGRAVGVIGVVAVLVALSPGLRTIEVPRTTEIPGAYDLVAAVCRDLPANAALFAETSSQPLVWGVALRVICDRPVVVTQPDRLPALMGAAADAGYDVLWFGVECTVPAGEQITAHAAQLPNLEQTVLRPPSHMSTDFYGVTVVRPAALLLDCG